MFVARGTVVKSDSDPDKSYAVFVSPQTASCTCPAFFYRPDYNCKHIIRFIGAASLDLQKVERTAEYETSVGGRTPAKLHDAWQAGFQAGVTYEKTVG